MRSIIRGLVRKHWPSLAACMLLVPIVSACTASANAVTAPDAPAAAAKPPEPTRIVVSHTTRTITMSSFYIAMQEGYAREEGLDVDYEDMNSTTSAQGIVAGQIDFGAQAGALLAAQ